MNRWIGVASLMGAMLVLGACGMNTPVQATRPAPAPAPPFGVVTPTLELLPSAGLQGQLITIQGVGWQPNVSVTLSLRPGTIIVGVPLELGEVMADRQGQFHLTQAVPNTARPGDWRITAANNSRLVQIVTVPFTILPPATAVAAMTPGPDISGTAPEAALSVSTGTGVAQVTDTPLSSLVWQGEYFDNPTLAGAPVLTRTDTDISFTWGTNAPAEGLPADHFSVRWTSTRPFDAGDYRISIECSGGARMSIDGVLVLDGWESGCVWPMSADVALGAGPHDLSVTYYKQTGEGMVRLVMQPLNVHEPTASGVPSGTAVPAVTADQSPTNVATTVVNTPNPAPTPIPQPPSATPQPPAPPTSPPPTSAPIQPSNTPLPPPTSTPVPLPTVTLPPPTLPPTIPPTEPPHPTDTPQPTRTPKPTETPQPTNTPKPTEVPPPTKVPKPTHAPKPTNGP